MVVRTAVLVFAVILSWVAETQSPGAPPPAPQAQIEALAMRNVALARSQARDYAGSTADLSAAIALYPGFREAYLDRAETKAALLDYAGAVADATQALALRRFQSSRRVGA